MDAANDVWDQIKLINEVQRLGLSYHFEKEIEGALQNIYTTYDCHGDEIELHDVSLLFRVLRQHGFYISCGKFNIYCKYLICNLEIWTY